MKRCTEIALKMYLYKTVSLFLDLIAIYGSLEFFLTVGTCEKGTVERYLLLNIIDRQEIILSYVSVWLS